MPETVSDSPKVEEKEKTEVEAEIDVEEKEQDTPEVELEAESTPFSLNMALVIAFYTIAILICFTYTQNILLTIVFISAIVAGAIYLDDNVSAYLTTGVAVAAFSLNQLQAMTQTQTILPQ